MEPQLMNNITNNINQLFRSPTLETVKMVENTIYTYSGEFKRTQLWQMLPRKVMWPTYLVILNYLKETNRIVVSDNGVITYIWDPELAKRYLSQTLLHHNVKTRKKKRN